MEMLSHILVTKIGCIIMGESRKALRPYLLSGISHRETVCQACGAIFSESVWYILWDFSNMKITFSAQCTIFLSS